MSKRRKKRSIHLKHEYGWFQGYRLIKTLHIMSYFIIVIFVEETTKLKKFKLLALKNMF